MSKLGLETRAHKTRRGLLDAAGRQIDRHGAVRLTLAAAAKVTVGLLYHFGTKHDRAADGHASVPSMSRKARRR